MAKKKATALDKMRERLAALDGFSKSIDFRSEPSGFVSTGVEEVDKYVLGCGGLPRGRMSEVYGAPGSGKSSFVYSCLRQCQLAGGIPVLIHTEEAGQKSRLVDTFGIDPSNFCLIEPDHMEGVVQAVEVAIADVAKSRAKDKPFVLVAWDSLAATRVKNHDEVGAKEAPAERARLINAALRVLPTMIARAQGHFMVVNQNRSKIGVIFGSPTTQPGGNAPKYHATFRLALTQKAKVGAASTPTGIEVEFHATKNKMGAPFRKVRSRLDFNGGWTDWGVVNLAKELGLVGARQQAAAAREALEAVGWDPHAEPPPRQKKASSKPATKADEALAAYADSSEDEEESEE